LSTVRQRQADFHVRTAGLCFRQLLEKIDRAVELLRRYRRLPIFGGDCQVFRIGSNRPLERRESLFDRIRGANRRCADSQQHDCQNESNSSHALSSHHFS